MGAFTTTAKIILLLMSWADALFTWAHEQKLINEGEAKAVEKAALALASRSKRARAIEADVAKLSDEEVRKELEAKGDLRD